MIALESKRSRFSIGGTFVDNGCRFYLILPRAPQRRVVPTPLQASVVHGQENDAWCR
jgi:hypothetical protein